MIEDVDLDLKRPSTIYFTIMDKVLLVIVEVIIGLRPTTLTTITQVSMGDFCVYLLLIGVFVKVFVAMKEVIVVVMMEYVDLGLKIPATLPFTIM